MQFKRISRQALFRIGICLGVALFLLALIVCLGRFINIGINISGSLPVKLVLIIKNADFGKGDIIAFHPPDSSLHQTDELLIKTVMGVPGDIVWQDDGLYFVNEVVIGMAQEQSRQGVKLNPGPQGKISEQHYFVGSNNPYSFDSRYAEIGWVQDAQIIGRVITLW